MKRLAVVCTVGAIFAGAVAATGTTGPSESATASASCTAEEKAAREEALRQYRQHMAAARKAYFKRVRDPKRRAAFVKRQRARLQALQTAAGCTVPPLPPSSGESCSFMFPANAGSFRFSEGPLSSDWLAPRGRVDAVMLFVDFPDAPANDNTISQLAARHTAHLAWFEEASYGRFSVSVTAVARWFRLPRPTSTYTPLPQSVHHPDVFADAVAAADGAVDFSRYQAVFVIGARDRAVCPLGEPLRVVSDPGMVRRGLQREVHRHLKAERLRLGHEPVERVEVAEVGVDGVVAALGVADSPGRAGIARSGGQGVVRAFAIGRADRVDGR
jgi:hypothetical protein